MISEKFLMMTMRYTCKMFKHALYPNSILFHLFFLPLLIFHLYRPFHLLPTYFIFLPYLLFAYLQLPFLPDLLTFQSTASCTRNKLYIHTIPTLLLPKPQRIYLNSIVGFYSHPPTLLQYQSPTFLLPTTSVPNHRVHVTNTRTSFRTYQILPSFCRVILNLYTHPSFPASILKIV